MTPEEMNKQIEIERTISESSNFHFSDCVFDNTVKLLVPAISQKLNPAYVSRLKKLMKVGKTK